MGKKKKALENDSLEGQQKGFEALVYFESYAGEKLKP